MAREPYRYTELSPKPYQMNAKPYQTGGGSDQGRHKMMQTRAAGGALFERVCGGMSGRFGFLERSRRDLPSSPVLEIIVRLPWHETEDRELTEGGELTRRGMVRNEGRHGGSGVATGREAAASVRGAHGRAWAPMGWRGANGLERQ